jgi:hypothetical protein
MAPRNDCSDANAVALRSRVRHRIGYWSGRDAEASRVGIERRLAARRRLMGRGRRSQARSPALLRFRLVRLLCVAHYRACLSFPDQRRSSVFHITLFRWDLARCRSHRWRGISCPRVCIMKTRRLTRRRSRQPLALLLAKPRGDSPLSGSGRSVSDGCGSGSRWAIEYV